MPYKYTFTGPYVQPFVCNLTCMQCEARTKRNTRCKRKVCIGLPVCAVHLLHNYHLRISPSTIQGAGHGLFAVKTDISNDNIVFRKGDTIIEYTGEIVSSAILNQRYGRSFAPYGANAGHRVKIDSACQRGIGAMANHKPARTANAKLVADDNDKVWLEAKKNILNQEEIFVSYGPQFQFENNVVSTTTKTRR